MYEEKREGSEVKPGRRQAMLLYGILHSPITLNFKHAKLPYNKYEQQDRSSSFRVSVLNRRFIQNKVTVAASQFTCTLICPKSTVFVKEKTHLFNV